jgi:tetratricopeptide (TPR) repeat protein
VITGNVFVNRLVVLVIVVTAVFLRGIYADTLVVQSTDALEIETAGIDQFRKGDYKKALDQIHKFKEYKDTAFRLYKTGLFYSMLGNESKAINNLRQTADKSAALAPFAYELIGDIQSNMGDNQNALNAYRVACNATVPQKYKDNVIAKINILYNKDSTNLPPGIWLEEFRKWLRPQIKTQVQVLALQLDSLINSGSWKILDSMLIAAVDKDPDFANVLERLSKADIPDSAFTTSTLFTMAQAAFSNRVYPAAMFFSAKAKARSDFKTTIPEKTADYFEARLVYATENFTKAIALFKAYEKKYGADSDLLMTIARAYRKADNDAEASKWYDKHVKMFPHHPKTQEILWLLAWRNELLDKYIGAGKYYQKIYLTFRDGHRVEESYLRRALCFYKREKYDSAIVVLDLFTKKYPSSRFAIAAQFWKAKSLLSLEKTDSATVIFSTVAKIEPYGFYANRSRQLLSLLGDTSEYVIDTTSDTTLTLAWLDSISPSSAKKPLSSSDSLSLYRGLILLMTGRVKESDFFLDQIEQSFPGNLSLQFRLSLSYQRYDASMQAFRVARRLTWRIPQENRNNLPFLIYKLFYPTFYADVIKRECGIRDVDPFLVSSVIRQESIFNPTIVSPAGAVGLMQIMPYTGKEIAKWLDESFSIDSLYQPNTNIRWGTRYLKELLDQFDGNLVLVLGAYNGGPHNAKRWYNKNKDEDFDLFVEDIEFTETRNYVKKVLSNYWTYQMLSSHPQYFFGSADTTTSNRKGKRANDAELADDH